MADEADGEIKTPWLRLTQQQQAAAVHELKSQHGGLMQLSPYHELKVERGDALPSVTRSETHVWDLNFQIPAKYKDVRLPPLPASSINAVGRSSGIPVSPKILSPLTPLPDVSKSLPTVVEEVPLNA